MVTTKPEAENRFFKAHENVMQNLNYPIKAEELYMMSLSGMVPLTKLPALEKRLTEMETEHEEHSS